MFKNKKILLTSIVLVVIVSMLTVTLTGCKKPAASSSDYADAMWYVNGYQQPVSDLSTIVRDGEEIVSVNTMLEAEGLSVSKSSDGKAIAEYIYNLAVTNAANVKNKGWMICTDASVHAEDAKALGILSMDQFDVGIRSVFTLAQGEKGNFSQTVSGVTQLDLQGLGSIGDSIKSNFGYNIQNFSNSEINAFRRGSNGGATYYTAATNEDYLKYLLGSYNSSFPTKMKDKGTEPKTFTVKAAEAATESEWTNPYNDEVVERPNAWSPLQHYTQDSFETSVYDTKTTYYLGNLGGVSWAVYDFAADFLADDTTVSYDASTDVYTLTINVKDDRVDDACKYAKATLVKDTKDYILLQSPKYTRLKNVIQVYGNGLIKSWERDEEMGSELPAKLVVLSGECNGGGATGNKSLSVFSYNDLDTNAERLAAIYWPELGQSSVVGSLALDLSSYPSFDTYQPIDNTKK